MKTYAVRKNQKGAYVIPLLLRALLVLLIVSIQMIYLPTSTQTTGGFEPKLPIDTFPLVPVWVLPYILCYPLWLAAIIWSTLKMNDDMFRAFLGAMLLTSTLAVATFVFLPTYVKASVIPGTDLFSGILRYIHQNWGRYDAFPSGHVYITVLFALFYHRWYPRYKKLWIAIPTIVCFSTLFTHQHYIADIVGGLVVALLGFHFGQRWAGFSLDRFSSTKRQPLRHS